MHVYILHMCTYKRHLLWLYHLVISWFKEADKISPALKFHGNKWTGRSIGHFLRLIVETEWFLNSTFILGLFFYSFHKNRKNKTYEKVLKNRWVIHILYKWFITKITRQLSLNNKHYLIWLQTSEVPLGWSTGILTS